MRTDALVQLDNGRQLRSLTLQNQADDVDLLRELTGLSGLTKLQLHG